ncbi:MAG: GNAT family N-acetyltransferase [Petrotogales bacterium]
MSITYKKGTIPDSKEINLLYDDAGFTSYTENLSRLTDAIKNSLFVITAWDKGNLVGLARAVGDGKTIIYIQDIIVLNSHRRKGIGTSLVKQIIYKFKDVRQKVLLTDDKPKNRKFYESLGFFSCDNGKLIAFARFDN